MTENKLSAQIKCKVIFVYCKSYHIRGNATFFTFYFTADEDKSVKDRDQEILCDII